MKIHTLFVVFVLAVWAIQIVVAVALLRNTDGGVTALKAAAPTRPVLEDEEKTECADDEDDADSEADKEENPPRDTGESTASTSSVIIPLRDPAV